MTTHHAVLAAACHSRDVAESYRASGEVEHIPDDLRPIWETLDAFYRTDVDATACAKDFLVAAATVGLRDPKRVEAVTAIIGGLYGGSVSVPNARALCAALKQRRLSEALATKLLVGGTGAAVTAEIDDLIAKYQEAGAPSDEETDEALWEANYLAPTGTGTDRVPVAPEALNAKIRGGLLPGHQLTLFARPEVGKSALALSIAVNAAWRGFRVLYLGNEDPQRDLMVRAVAMFARQSPTWVLEHLDEALAIAARRNSANLYFRDMAPGSLAEIERHVRKIQPRLVVIDQLRNIHAGPAAKSDTLTTTLDKAQQGARNLAKRYGYSSVTVTQAGDSARGKVVLNDGDVDSSNTGISAGCDVLVGIGMTEALDAANQRMLTLCKNKIGGTHGQVLVGLDPLSLRFTNPRE